MADLSGPWKARLGRGAVVAQGLAAWWRYGFPPVTARWEGGGATGAFACVSNIPLYGGPFAIAPDARLDDDILDAVVLRTGGRLAAITFWGDLLRGRHLGRHDVVAGCAREVELTGPAELPLQIDGDACRETLPVRVTVSNERLQVLVPGG